MTYLQIRFLVGDLKNIYFSPNFCIIYILTIYILMTSAGSTSGGVGPVTPVEQQNEGLHEKLIKEEPQDGDYFCKATKQNSLVSE